MIGSLTLPIGFNSAMCLLLDVSLASPFLGMGIAYENFQESGKMPSFIKRLKRFVRGFVTARATDFSSLELIKFGPDALLTFSEERISYTSLLRNFKCF